MLTYKLKFEDNTDIAAPLQNCFYLTNNMHCAWNLPNEHAYRTYVKHIHTVEMQEVVLCIP
jgi:hypothetical protein